MAIMHLPFVHNEKEQSGSANSSEPLPSQRTSRDSRDTKASSKLSYPPQSHTAPARQSSTYTRQPSNIQHAPNSKKVANQSSKNASSQRPGLQRRRTTARTRYIDMLLGLDEVPRLHNIFASASVWILLAGYIVFPATFNKLADKDFDDKTSSEFSKHALATVRNVPLLYVAAFACGVGILGCLCLWWKHRSNYVWVINRIFLPALLNSLAGFISTIVNVYSAQEGKSNVFLDRFVMRL